MGAAKCNECGAEVDIAKDSDMGHCATCNNIVEIGKDTEKPDEGKAAEQKPAAKDEVKK